MIDPSIPLQARTPQVESPMDAITKTTSIANMLSAIQERKAQAAAIAEEAPLRRAETAQRMKQLAESNALNSAFDSAVGYDQDAGDLTYDDTKAAQTLQSANMGHLLPQYQQQKEQRLAAHRRQAIDELDTFNKKLQLEATPAENFLALPADKKKAGWSDLRSTLLKTDPSRGKVLPYDYDPDVIDPKLQELVAAHEQTKDVHQKLTDAQEKETLAKVEDDKLSPEDRWKKYNPAGGPMPVWYRNAIAAKKSGVNAPPAATYADKKITTLNGNNLPEDATDREGNAIPQEQRTANTMHEQRQDPNGRIYYQVTKAEKQTTFQQKTQRIEKAYAFTIGKKYEDMTDAERVAADKWYAEQAPAKKTEIDKRLEIYERNPDLYQALFGHGGAAGDKPVTQAQKASILGRINTEITKQGLQGKEADDFKKSRLDELKEAGIDMTGAAVTKPKPVTMFDSGTATGMLTPPTIKNLYDRKILDNKDGTYSTTKSMSFEENGKEILIPTVVDGKKLSDNEAIDRYHKTGEHLGIFKDAASADAYATALHNEQARRQPMPEAIRKQGLGKTATKGQVQAAAAKAKIPYETLKSRIEAQGGKVIE